MNQNKVTIFHDMASYNSFYVRCYPRNEKTLVPKVYKLVGQLVSAHCDEITELSDLVEVNTKMDALICLLKGEFELTFINLDKYDYPHFIQKLSGANFFAELSEYNSLIIDLLKVILFKIDNSEDDVQIEKYVFDEVISLLERNHPKMNRETIFNDAIEPTPLIENETDIESKIKAIVSEQLDISL